MKTEFIIGEKPDIKKVFVKLIIISILLLMMYQSTMPIIETSPYFRQYPEGILGMKVAIIVGGVLTIFSSFTSVSLRQYIILTDTELRYYSNDGFISQIRNTFAILFNRKRAAVIKVSLDQIKDITLLYSTITTTFYYTSHSIVYHITLDDDSCITINPDSFHFTNANISEGIDYLIQQGVKIKDPYNLIAGLKDNKIKFAEYVEKVILKK